MPYSHGSVRQSLTVRLTRMYGEQAVHRTLRDLATDLIGASDPADLPAECRAWVERAIDDAAVNVAQLATDSLMDALAVSFANAPEDLGHCALMQAVIRAQAIHVTEVR